MSQWLVVAALALTATSFAEGATVFSDDFNRADAATLGADYVDTTSLFGTNPVTIVSNQACSTTQGIGFVQCTVAVGSTVTIRNTFQASTTEGFESYLFLADLSALPNQPSGQFYSAGCDGGYTSLNNDVCRLKITYSSSGFLGSTSYFGASFVDVPMTINTAYTLEAVFSTSGISVTVSGGTLSGAYTLSTPANTVSVDASSGLWPGFLVGRDQQGHTCSDGWSVEADSSAPAGLALCSTDDCTGASGTGMGMSKGKGKSGKCGGSSSGKSGSSSKSGSASMGKNASPVSSVGTAGAASTTTSSTLVAAAIAAVVVVAAAVVTVRQRRVRRARAQATGGGVENFVFNVDFDAPAESVAHEDAEPALEAIQL